MTSIPTSEGNLLRCPICAQLADSADGVCSTCGNSLAFPDPTEIAITLAAFPQLNRDVIDRIRQLVNEAKPRRLRLDFAGVQLPSPVVFAGFMTLVKDVKKLESAIVVRNVDPRIHDMFVITRVDGLIETEPSV